MLGVWAAPGASETLPKDGGLRPPPFVRVSGAPGAVKTPGAAKTPKSTYNIPEGVELGISIVGSAANSMRIYG